jgi:hypothetical protein
MLNDLGKIEKLAEKKLWKYDITKLSMNSPIAAERALLNVWGSKGWECYEILKIDDFIMYYFKKEI